MNIIEIYSIKSEGKNYGIYESWDDAYNKVKRLSKKHPEQKFEIIERKALIAKENTFTTFHGMKNYPFNIK